MDKLSEHAIRMLEIVNREGVCNSDVDVIAKAVYDLILQVQMLKMADRKTEPNGSEKPNNSLDKDTNVRSKEPHHSGEVTEVVTDKYQSCDNCDYEYFDSRAYPCSRCIHNKPEADMWTEKVVD
jgi:hypothetical protein